MDGSSGLACVTCGKEFRTARGRNYHQGRYCGGEQNFSAPAPRRAPAPPARAHPQADVRPRPIRGLSQARLPPPLPPVQQVSEEGSEEEEEQFCDQEGSEEEEEQSCDQEERERSSDGGTDGSSGLLRFNICIIQCNNTRNSSCF